MPMFLIASVLVLVLAGDGRALADVENLEQFLRSVEAATSVPSPLRGDGQFEVAGTDGTQRTAVAVIVRPPADMYIELQGDGSKLLLLTQPEQGYRLAKGAAKAEALPANARIENSDFVRADLEPFRLSPYTAWRISDDSANELTVTLFPQKTSQYSLVVTTFDRDKKVPIKTLYYQETLNNLVKMERANDYVLVGRKWMPATISMETFKLRTHSTLTLRWSQVPSFPSELFDPVFLPHPSGILWPAATPAP
jgi:outer membrane lipoprotein-sorting protein